jgi:hypothetical protein
LPQPIPPNLQQEEAKLKTERELLNAERMQAVQATDETGSAHADEIIKMRLRLAGLLTKLGTKERQGKQKAPEKSSLPPEPRPGDSRGTGGEKPQRNLPGTKTDSPPRKDDIKPSAAAKSDADVTTKPVDAMGLAQALFRTGDYEGALSAYRLLDPKSLGKADRPGVQYMTATCLRKLGKTDEAANLYREVANSKDDEALADCAQWQLSALRWRRDLEAQLAKVRQRRQALEIKP